MLFTQLKLASRMKKLAGSSNISVSFRGAGDPEQILLLDSIGQIMAPQLETILIFADRMSSICLQMLLPVIRRAQRLRIYFEKFENEEALAHFLSAAYVEKTIRNLCSMELSRNSFVLSVIILMVGHYLQCLSSDTHLIVTRYLLENIDESQAHNRVSVEILFQHNSPFVQEVGALFPTLIIDSYGIHLNCTKLSFDWQEVSNLERIGSDLTELCISRLHPRFFPLLKPYYL